jgi:hypothetical protein
MSLRGTPTRIQSDRGEQLVAAAKQISTWDFKEVVQWAGKKGIEWTLVPTGGQHFNGQAERMIGLVKKQLWKTFEGKRLSHEETLTLLAEAVQKINSRPITRNLRPEGEPLCVQDLMLGRAKPGQVEVKFETGKQLTQRFENIQRTQQEFWKRWIEEVFPEMLKQSKWKRDKRDLKVGDIVLRKDETAAGQTYKYAKVIKVHTSADGKVRAADIEYKLPRESVFRTTTRSIHKLVLVVPVEEQAVAGEQEEEEAAGAEQPASLAVEEPGLVQQEEARATETAPLAIGEPRPPRQGGGWSRESRRRSPSRGSPGGHAPARHRGAEKAKSGSEIQESDFSEEGRRTSTNNYCISAKGRRRDGGRRNEAKEEGKAKENPWKRIHQIRARGVFWIPVRECARTL